MTLQKDVERGAAAQALLQSPVYQEAWAEIRSAIHEKWESLGMSDQAKAQELKMLLGLLIDLQTIFETTVSNGNRARDELDRINERRVLSPKQWMNR